MKRVAAALCVVLAGCAQMLGLDNTKFQQLDGPIDTPSVCDGDGVLCAPTEAGRAVCGQLFGTGAAADSPLRVAAPTGELCAPGSTEGPCGLQVSALAVESLFDGSSTGEKMGQIDDCGRFAVVDLDPSLVDVAVKFSDGATTYQTTATLLLGRAGAAGQADRDIAGYGVLISTTMEWATQLGVTPRHRDRLPREVHDHRRCGAVRRGSRGRFGLGTRESAGHDPVGLFTSARRRSARSLRRQRSPGRAAPRSPDCRGDRSASRDFARENAAG